MATRGVEALFDPGQLLTLEADNLMQQVRNSGARLNRLKLSRSSPDPPLWWQFLSSPDGTSEALDRTAFDLHCVLRDLEQATSQLKRLCIAPASDIAGNVQHEMQKKRWAVATLDRWSNVLKGATASRAESAAAGGLQEQQRLEKQRRHLRKKERRRQLEQQQQQSGSEQQASSSSAAQQQYQQQDQQQGGTEALASPLQAQRDDDRGGGAAAAAAARGGDDGGGYDSPYSSAHSSPMPPMSPRRSQLVREAMEAHDRVERLRVQLQQVESANTSSLKLAQKFRELDYLETRFTNVKTRRRQFQEQVLAHLSALGAEIEHEADERRTRARHYYDAHAKQLLELSRDPSERESNNATGKNNRAGTAAGAAAGSSSTHQAKPPSSCAECAAALEECKMLEQERRALWVNRAVRVLCTQAVDPEQQQSSSRTLVPSHRLLALVGSRKSDGRAVCIRPLLSRKVVQPAAAAGGNSSGISFDVPAVQQTLVPLTPPPSAARTPRQQLGESTGAASSPFSAAGGGAVAAGEQEATTEAPAPVVAVDATWNVPSAFDHSKYWKVKLQI